MRILLSLALLSALVACNEPASAPLTDTSAPVPVKIARTHHSHRHSRQQRRNATLLQNWRHPQHPQRRRRRVIKKGQILAQLALDEIKARVTQAQSGLEKAQRDLKRTQSLYNDQVVTLEQVQNATTSHDVADADLRVAKFNLKHATIRAPAKGRILKRFAERRELITPGTPIFLIASAEQNKILRIGLTDREIVRIQRNDHADITFDAYPNKTFSALVTEIAESAHPHTGTSDSPPQSHRLSLYRHPQIT